MRARVGRRAILLVVLLGSFLALAQPSQVVDLRTNDPEAWPGFTLMAPISLTTTYLLDMDGRVVHTWESDAPAGNAVYLLENGNLLRTEQVIPSGRRTFNKGGAGGRLREMAPDGSVVWEYTLSTSQRRLHHDIAVLPNGNILAICWEAKTADQAIAMGRDPAMLKDAELWPDSILEIEPVRPQGGRIVWEWHVWDHLIQDRDPALPNYGVVSEHPERIDINFAIHGGSADWNHTNSVAYNEPLDQIALSVHEFGEIWIIDHSTSTSEAAGSEGGRYGRGGDLLYRWGNPQAYGAGEPRDQTLWGQHDANWVGSNPHPVGGSFGGAETPGGTVSSESDSGESANPVGLLVFNNGMGRPGAPFSTVDEIALPILEDGSYRQPQVGRPYLPVRLAWRYRAEGFYSSNISGAQRLPNGSTLICEGAKGRIFEVTQEGEIVWEYINPFAAQGPNGARNEVFKVRRYAADDPRLQSLLGE